MKIINELPFTSEALKIYIEEAIKCINQLTPAVNEFNRLKHKLK